MFHHTWMITVESLFEDHLKKIKQKWSLKRDGPWSGFHLDEGIGLNKSVFEGWVSPHQSGLATEWYLIGFLIRDSTVFAV